LGAMSINWVHVELRSRRSRVRIPLKPWCFQASSFQLLKLENLLRWSFFTFIYNRSSNMNYFIYTSNHYIIYSPNLLTGDIDFHRSKGCSNSAE